MFRPRLPRTARILLWVRVLNQLGAFALAFLAVLAGPGLVTATLAVFGVAALVSRWVGGLLLDRWPPRAVIAFGLTATGCGLGALAIAQSPVPVLVATAAVGLAFEIYEPATSELLARATTGVQRHDAYVALGSWLAAAGAVAGLLAAVLLPFGVRWLLVADAITCLAAAAIAWTWLPRGVRHPGRSRRGRGLWRPPATLTTLTVAATAFAFGDLAVMMFLPFLLLQRGAPAWLPGLTLAVAALAALLAGRLARRPLARFSREVQLTGGTALLAGFTLAMAGMPGLVPTTMIFVGWAVTASMLLGHWPAMVADIAPPADRPRWFAFLGLSWGLAQPAVPGVIGLTAGLVAGPGTAALLVGGVAFSVVPPVLAMARGSAASGTRQAGTVPPP